MAWQRIPENKKHHNEECCKIRKIGIVRMDRKKNVPEQRLSVF